MDMLLYFLGRLANGGTGGGGGTEYTSIVYNTDNTVTLTDKDGVIHTMSCTYADGKLIGVTYDGKAVDLTYNGDALVKVGKTSVDVANAPATSGATLNIAYGETAPEDTSKLWVKANEPANVSVGSDIDSVESIAQVGVLPTNLYAMGCAAVGNKIYLFGGSFAKYDVSNAIRVFNTETKELTTLDVTLPTVLESMGCTAVGNKIYLFGGRNATYNINSSYNKNTIYMFDTESEILTTLGTTIGPGYNYSCATVGNKVYLFGGATYTSGGYTVYSNAIQVFDTQTKELTTLATTLPSACHSMGCAAVGNKIYLFGGNIIDPPYHLNTINVFDTQTKGLTTLTTALPSTCYKMGCAAVGNKIYLFGGVPLNNTIQVFDPLNKTLTTLGITLPTTNSDMGCAAVGTAVYLFGGGRYNDTLYSTIQKLSVTHELTQGNIEIQSSLINNKFNLVNTDNAQIEIGVENVYIGNENNEAELCEAYLHNGTEWVVI